MINSLKNNDYFKLIIICLFSILLDYLFFINISDPPGWDQGYHLGNLFKMFNILDNKEINIFSKFNEIIDVSDTYRGPLTYFLSSIILKLFGNSYKAAYLSNHLFNFISIFSIYEISKIIKDNRTGVWATVFYSLSPIIVQQRSDYLIDISLTAFSILFILVLTKWKNDENNISLYSAISGLSLGLIFLTKPTGIIIFLIPIFILIRNKISKNKNYSFFEIFGSFFIFLFTIYFWFSRHFITIIGSTLNAWKWGLNYQDGLDANSLEGWFFYFRKLPDAFGKINFLIIIIFLVIIISRIKPRILDFINLKNKHFWFLSFFLNYYLIASLMSTKEIRFMMPIYPLICIYFSIIFNSIIIRGFRNIWKRNIMILSITLSIFISLQNNINIGLLKNNNFYSNWPHEEILETIEVNNPFINSILAVIPDTKEINTFNLEAEAIRRGEKVKVRQIISNLDSYKDDLKYFDWFLIKTDEQGIMTSQSKALLQKEIIKSQSFILEKKWLLKDKSRLSLYRRKNLNSHIEKKECRDKNQFLSIKQIPNGLNINLKGNGNLFKKSNMFFDISYEDINLRTNFSIAQGLKENLLKNNDCYELSQDIPINLKLFNKTKKAYINARLITQDNKVKLLTSRKKLLNINPVSDQDLDNILFENKIMIVSKLGNFLKLGEYEKLFNLVGILNQSDPNQNYLFNAESIYNNLYNETKQLDDLYSILISQVLQRKINNANQSIEKIITQDSNNGNAFLAKAIINTYLLNPKEALKAIDMCKNLNKSVEADSILSTVEGIANLLNLNFVKAYQLIS